MRLKIRVTLIVLFIAGIVQAQDTEKILLSIDGKNVYNSEFIRVFEKNKDIVVEDEQKDFDDYFDLFVNFKLKLAQARDLQLDTLSSYISELEKYREQLIQPYLQNPEASEKLVREAYDRTVYEVNASHILIKITADAEPLDTLAAYRNIESIRHQLLEGADFEKVAREQSQDPSVSMNNGELGYFSAFDMVYAFENAAYKTEVGQVSKPFRTQFGYHIVKVNDKRKSPGEVEVAHIMVKNDSLKPNYAEDKILDIYNKLNQGGDFATIAKEHSDDQGSAREGGKLPKFGTGRMIKSFEDIAFQLNEVGDFSSPFESSYGWHILKLLKKYPVPSYTDLHSRLETKVKNGSRSGYVERSLAQNIAKDYSIEEYKGKWNNYAEIVDFKQGSDSMLRIEDQIYSYHDLYVYSQSVENISKDALFADFKNKMIINYYKDHLEEINEEFALTYQEYKDGLLLFELLQREIWEKSEKDSLGLQSFFNNNRDKYIWKKRGDLTIASCTRYNKAEIVKELMSKGVHHDSIKERVNEGATIHVLFSLGRLEEGSSKLPEGYQLTAGVSRIFEEEENSFTIVKADAIFEPQWKELKETRGEVMNDYQNFMEDQWVKKLYKTYKVKVNTKNYRDLKQRFTER